MTNIWTEAFKEIRKPYFEMKDPYVLREEKEDKAGEKYEGKYKKSGKKSKDYDGDGTVEDEADEYAGVKDRAIKKAMKKEAVEHLIEVDKTQRAQKKIEPMPPGKKNRVTIGPQIKEEIQEWMGELVEEGYDLSKFTLDEIVDIYESVELDEANTAGMPARGDAQTVEDSQSKKLARARIKRDMANIQYQRAIATAESFDAIVDYLSQRSDVFETIDEAVFDPKKTKMRPSSERTQGAITPATRAAQKKAAQRTADIHSKGETVLAGLRSSGTRGRVQTTPTQKPAAPSANRTVKGRYDKLAAAANKVLKDLKK